MKLAKNKSKNGSIIYAGSGVQNRSNFDIYGWDEIDKLIKNISNR